MNVKRSVNSLLRPLGYKITRTKARTNKLGINAFRDMAKLANASASPIVFDVGANIGQTVDAFNEQFSQPKIHCFEPNPVTFQELECFAQGMSNVTLNNFALGAQSGVAPFYTNEAGSPMDSLLKPGSECFGGIKDVKQVKVKTIDDYCHKHRIDKIDILKSDAQGFDYEVLKGAERMLSQKAVQLIYLEINFGKMYEELPRFDKLYGYLMDKNYRLVTFYHFHYWDNRAYWTDGLFIQEGFA